MLTLNYPVYFYAAIKDNTALDQYEIFNILFIGDTYQNNGCNAVSQGSSSISPLEEGELPRSSYWTFSAHLVKP